MRLAARRGAGHRAPAAIAASVNHTVRLPRCCRRHHIRLPIRHAVPLAGMAMTASGVNLERHGGHPGIKEKAAPLRRPVPRQPDLSMQQGPGEGNCFVFRWNPKTGAEIFDNFLDAARRAGNRPQLSLGQAGDPGQGPYPSLVPERPDVDGHDERARLRRPDLHPRHTHHGTGRATGRLTDHAQWQPKGVFHERSGTATLSRSCRSATW